MIAIRVRYFCTGYFSEVSKRGEGPDVEILQAVDSDINGSSKESSPVNIGKDETTRTTNTKATPVAGESGGAISKNAADAMKQPLLLADMENKKKTKSMHCK